MKDLIVTSGIVGAISPFVIAVLNQVKWTARVKSSIAFVFCIVAAAVTLYAEGSLDFTTENYLMTLMAVFTAAKVAYEGLWKPALGIHTIEAKTSLDKTP